MVVLKRAEARWHRAGIDDYRFRIRLRCECPSKPERITVKNGKPHGAGPLRGLGTVPQLFTNIRHALRSPRSGEVRVSYGKRGVPYSAYIDRIRRAVDDELAWRVDHFRRRR